MIQDIELLQREDILDQNRLPKNHYENLIYNMKSFNQIEIITIKLTDKQEIHNTRIKILHHKPIELHQQTTSTKIGRSIIIAITQGTITKHNETIGGHQREGTN